MPGLPSSYVPLPWFISHIVSHRSLPPHALQDELKSRQRVLRRLGYVDEEGVVSLKGRLAGGLMLSEGELVMCEMVSPGTSSRRV